MKYMAFFKIINPFKENDNIRDFYICSSEEQEFCYDETVDYIFESCRNIEENIKEILKIFKKTEEDIDIFLDEWYTKIMRTIALKEITSEDEDTEEK